MDGIEVTESLNEWEQIESPSTKSIEWIQPELSIFPPSDHQGLPVQTPPPPSLDDTQIHIATASAVECNAEGGGVLESSSSPETGNEFGKCLRLRYEILRSRVFWIASRLASCRWGGGIWPCTPAFVVMAVVILLSRMKQRRRRLAWKERESHLIFLLKEKDQKISQLMLQIEQMKEMLSASRRVPVIRVISNKYLNW